MMAHSIIYNSDKSGKKMQIGLLKTTVQYLYNYSSYFRSTLDGTKIDISTINSFDDLQKIPVTTKEDLLKFNSDCFCCNLSAASDIVTTSGSTGPQPIIHPLTKSDLQRLTYNEEMSFRISNVTSTDLVMLITALDGSFVAGLAYYLGIKSLGANIIRAGSKNLSMQAEILNKFPVTTIVGVPSNLIKLKNYCLMEGQNNSRAQISKLVLIGETIRNKNFSLNQLGKRLLECYPEAKLYSTYANTETCTSFCECDLGNGGHLHPDLAYIEILDKNDQRVPEGTEGRLVMTTFGCQGMPLLRYDTGDITFAVNEKCGCERTTQRIGPILGRAKNILKISGITFSQVQLENAILAAPYVADYCAVVKTNEDGVQYVIIYFSSKEAGQDTEIQELKQRIWESVRISPEIKKCNMDELKNMQTSTKSRKALRFIHQSY